MKEAVDIKVPSKGGENKNKENEKKEDPSDAKQVLDPVTLSEEDEKLKNDLEDAVQLLFTVNTQEVTNQKLQYLQTEIQSATSSMTSVPKPLKFLRIFYDQFKQFYENVLAMTMAVEGSRESLKFKLLGNTQDLGSWGHEYVRSLCGEIGMEYTSRIVDEKNNSDHRDLIMLVDIIVPFHIQHHAEPEAIDILLEIQNLKKLLTLKDIDENNYQRICVYLLSCADFIPDPDDLDTLYTCTYELYKRMDQYTDALRVALRAQKVQEWVLPLFQTCKSESMKKQMGYILARHRVQLDYEEENEEIHQLIGNNSLSGYFLQLARDLDVVEVKTPENIYMSHLSETASTGRAAGNATLDSARHNLASTFVNAFVNAGFGTDTLMTVDDSNWLYKNKEHGMMSAAASLGLLLLWNVEEGLTKIDKYLYSGEDFTKAGAILAIGMVSSGVRNDCDPALALLSEQVEATSSTIKGAACTALGMAYGGTAREDVAECLTPIASTCPEDGAVLPEVMYDACLASLSLGMIYVGTCDEEIASTLIQRLMCSTDAELEQPLASYIGLGIGLLFLGKQEKADAMIEAVRTVEHKMGKYAAITIETCAYAGSGNVLKVQQMLKHCADHLEENAEHQAAAVLGIGLVTMGESIGSSMAVRAFDHLLQYGELPVRRAVPLAYALLYVSNAEYTVVDTLSRLTHDVDSEVAMNATLALGIVSAGTNSSRVAGLLRQLSEYYAREANNLFIVRIAQALLHMGKGLMTLQPFHSDRLLQSGVAVGGILAVLHAALDMKRTILDKAHFVMYYLVSAMNPRMLITLDEELNPLPVTVRVGEAVEVVGQAGKPKAITGFQTHTTPVVLNVQDRAQLATEEYLPCANVLEGVVILRKNPDYDPNEV